MEASIKTDAATRSSDKVLPFRPWFKMYGDDVLLDPRVVSLDDRTFRTYVELLAVANTVVEPGTIPGGTEFAAKMIRVEPGLLTAALERFEQAQLVLVDDDGTIFIVADEKHYGGVGLTASYAAKNVAGRKAKSRAARAERACHDEGHGTGHGDFVGDKKTENDMKTENVFYLEHKVMESYEVEDDEADEVMTDYVVPQGRGSVPFTLDLE